LPRETGYGIFYFCPASLEMLSMGSLPGVRSRRSGVLALLLSS